MLRVFTEGDDNKFVKIYLESLGHTYKSDFAVEATGGWTKINLVRPKIQEYIDKGDIVVLVFDADDNSNGGGYAVRAAAIEQVLIEQGLEIDFFLFPNNADDGDFESLLIQIATAGRQGVFNCFNNYEACVLGLNDDFNSFKTPLRKSRIYAYFECIDEPSSQKDQEMRDKTLFFGNNSYWDLTSAYLNPLRDFLIARI